MQPITVRSSWWRLTCILLVSVGLLHASYSVAAVKETGAKAPAAEFISGGELRGDGAKSVKPNNVRVPRPERIHEPMRLPCTFAAAVQRLAAAATGICRAITAEARERVRYAGLVGMIEIRI